MENTLERVFLFQLFWRGGRAEFQICMAQEAYIGALVMRSDLPIASLTRATMTPPLQFASPRNAYFVPLRKAAYGR